MEAGGLGCQCVGDYLTAAVDWILRTTLDRSERPSLVPPSEGVEYYQRYQQKVRVSPSVMIVAGVRSLALDQPQSEHQPTTSANHGKSDKQM